MRGYTLNTKRLMALFLLVQCFSCSDEGGNEDENGQDTAFEPIEITFTENFLTECNEVRTIEGVNLSLRPYTQQDLGEGFAEELIGTCNLGVSSFFTENREGHPFEGQVAFFFFGGVFEIDFAAFEGVSRIILDIEDNCGSGCSVAKLYNGDTITAEAANTVSNPNQEALVFDNISNEATRVRMFTGEGAIYRIRLE